MLSSAASRPSPARTDIPRRRARLREQHRNLFDLLLDETYLWETLLEKHKDHAIQILARLIVQAVRDNPEEETNHE
jgi:hypothetical protein